MTRHQLFLVHGMGNFEPGWSADLQTLITEAYAGYQLAQAAPFADLFEFREVTYNHLFEERRTAWEEKSAEINAMLVANGFSDDAVERLMDFANAATGDDFFRTHILDVIMYRFMPQIAEQIRRAIQLQILETLDEFPENVAGHWSVVAHSLGTSVIHDTLHAVFTHSVAGTVLPATARPRVLCMVANVSRVLWNDIDFYSTRVRPSPLPSQGVCARYINAHHALDPFPRAKPFHRPAPEWLTDEARAARAYRNVRLPAEDITDWNVHGFDHYLKNPRVQVELFRGLTFDRGIRKAELDEKIAAYERTRLQANVRRRVLRELEAVNPGALDDWEELTEVITQFRQLVLDNSANGGGG